MAKDTASPLAGWCLLHSAILAPATHPTWLLVAATTAKTHYGPRTSVGHVT